MSLCLEAQPCLHVQRLPLSRPRFPAPVSLLALVILSLILPPAPTAASPTAAEYAVVLNLSGKQRMLSQKMSKEALLVALGVDVEKNIDNLGKTSALFDKTLQGLRDGSNELRLPPTTNGRILRQLKRTAGVWDSYHETLSEIIKTRKVAPEQIGVIQSGSDELLNQMNRCVRLYEKDANTSGLSTHPELATTINLAGKQRMLCQKLSKEFLLTASGCNVADNRLNAIETISFFDRTLKGLMDGDAALELTATKSPRIRKQLSVVQGLWNDFKPLVEESVKAAPSIPIKSETVQKVASMNPVILKEMNAAVEMYEEEAAGIAQAQ